MKSKSRKVEQILQKLEKKQLTKEKLEQLGLKHFSEKTLERIQNCGNFIQSVLTADERTGCKSEQMYESLLSNLFGNTFKKARFYVRSSA